MNTFNHAALAAAFEALGKPPTISPRPTVARLMVDVAAGIRVLRDRDGVTLTEKQINDRAANIVMGLLGNYQITGTGE